MNCKPGDLAVIVSSRRFAGRLVRCVAYVGEVPWTSLSGDIETLPTWRIDTRLKRNSPFPEFAHYDWLVADVCLRPIRPQSDDAECESKAWLPPVPNSTKETVNG